MPRDPALLYWTLRLTNYSSEWTGEGRFFAQGGNPTEDIFGQMVTMSGEIGADLSFDIHWTSQVNGKGRISGLGRLRKTP